MKDEIVDYSIDNSPIRNDRCIRTSSGIYIDVFEPTEDMISIEDIAHSLSHQCRYGGHLPVFYSVAEHSMFCANAIRTINPELELTALLHDASEAYLLDMPRPIKYQIPQYKDIEDKLMKVIASKFGFKYPLMPLVKDIDDMALHQEWKVFFNSGMTSWPELTRKEVKHNFLDHFKTISK